MQEGLTVIVESGHVTSADRIRASLESQGIECFLDGEHVSSWRYPSVHQTVRILVYPSDASRALDLLRKENLLSDPTEMKTNIWTGLVLTPIPLVLIVAFLYFIFSSLWSLW